MNSFIEHDDITQLSSVNSMQQQWLFYIRLARNLARQRKWQDAVEHYSNAYLAAAYLNRLRCSDKSSFECFLRTSMEMVYAFRKAGFFDDIKPLIKEVADQLKHLNLPYPHQLYLKPLYDVGTHPICAVDVWMEKISARNNHHSSWH